MAVIRAEGSNGDREMAAAIYAGGMEPWDITMTDLLSEKVSLDSFKSFQNSQKFSNFLILEDWFLLVDSVLQMYWILVKVGQVLFCSMRSFWNSLGSSMPDQILSVLECAMVVN